jgi:hypothetical protein
MTADLPPASGEPLPPCPICGKDDLFMGTDGKPGCPHCEIAVSLPASGEPADVERDALIEVVSNHPRWTEEDQCNLCPGDEPYEQHIASFLATQRRQRR